MDIQVSAAHLEGRLAMPSSKSELHRAIIIALLTPRTTVIKAGGLSVDVRTTLGCAEALGATIAEFNDSIEITGPEIFADKATLHVGESGSTLRFFLPLVAALGITTTFVMEEGLAKRPHQPLLDQLTAHGCAVEVEGNQILVSDQMLPGVFSLPSNLSSQYISGLLMALPLLYGPSSIELDGALESYGYVNMTLDLIEQANIDIEEDELRFDIPGNQTYFSPSIVRIGGDWSAAAFWLVADAIGANVHITNLDEASYQPDSAIRYVFEHFGTRVVEHEETFAVQERLDEAIVDLSQTPDLAPALAVLAAFAHGQTSFTHAARLRLKESDRIDSICKMLIACGVKVHEEQDGFAVYGPAKLKGGVVDSYGDHRIAMAAAILGCFSPEGVTIKGAECVQKSYPDFFANLEQVGGQVRRDAGEEAGAQVRDADGEAGKRGDAHDTVEG